MAHQIQAAVFGAISVILIALTAPLLLELFLVTGANLLPGRKRGTDQEAQLYPIERLMIIVPSHNEELSILSCIESLRASAAFTDVATEIMVIAHNCSDRTAEIARAAGAVVSVLDDTARAGKGEALSHAFELAFSSYNADAVLVIDADTKVSPKVVPLVVNTLQSCEVAQCRDESRGAGRSLRDHLYALAFLGMNVVRPIGRQRLGLSCGIFGNGFALRREVLQRVSYNAHSIIEDLEFHLSLNAAGIKTHFIPQALVRADPPVDMAGIHSQSARWEGGRLRMLIARGPAVLKEVMQGRLQLIEPLIDLMSIPLTIGLTLLLLLLMLPVHAARMYAAAGLVLVALHISMAIRYSPDRSGDALALLYAPLYLLSKLSMVPAVLRMAKSRAAWIRTSRVSADKHSFARTMLTAFKRAISGEHR